MIFIKYFLLSAILFLSSITSANPLDKMISSLQEQANLIEWVKDNAQVELKDSDALKIIREAYAQGYSSNINPHLILAIMKTESGFKHTAKSKEGATGLMQVIPRWHKDKLKNRNPIDMKVSIEVGTMILSDCYAKYNGNNLKALNCYSGGGGKKYLNKVFSYKQVITTFVNNTANHNAVILASR